MKINIGLDDSQRQEITHGLAKLLADSYTLYLKTQNFHWNVQGPLFSTLHNLFEKQYLDLANAVDEIAERIRALGEAAPGSYQQFAKLTRIEEEVGVPNAPAMIKQLVEGHEAVIKTAREALPIAEQAHDAPTVDVLTRRMETHEKHAWMLRSMLENN